ncbi:MAG TPA: fluoride efflux transporter CrcB [Phycisphaerales bacterium]|nr:fluoride efflux transporter CrcB [Phycisphaerales bacterium]
MNQWLLVALGGAAGSVARYAIAGALNPLSVSPAAAPSWSAFPTGTFAVNLIGCALIGLLTGWITSAASQAGAYWQPFLLTGLLGGFTTFSAFGMETVHLLRAGMLGVAVTYIVASVTLGVSLAAAGYLLASRSW